MKHSVVLFFAVAFLAGPVVTHAANSVPTTGIPSAEWEYIRDVNGRTFGAQITKVASYDEDDLTSIYRLRKGVLTDHLKTKDKVAAADQAIWDIFTSISDKETLAKRMLVFATYEDPTVTTLASVQKLGKKEQSWALLVNANAARPESMLWSREMAIVLLHEYSHMLTLKSGQVDAKKKAAAQCKNKKQDTFHVPGFGCTKPDSYLNSFVNKFWSPEEIKAAEKAQERGDTMSFFRSNRDSYVTWYAASGPAEDIAESFVDFVLRKKPAGINEWEQKILFFYEYPELVKIRTELRANLKKYF